jgi:chromosome segregation ATPase
VRNFTPKRLGNKNITGSQLCGLVEALCHILNSDAIPNLDDVWQLVAAQSRQRALEQAIIAFTDAASTLEGVAEAFSTYKDLILDDGLSGEDTYTFLYQLLQNDIRGQEFEQKFIDTKREFDVYTATSIIQLKDAEGHMRDHESNLASAHRKVAHLVDEGLTMQHRLKELESTHCMSVQEPTDLLEVLDGLQTKHKALKLELTDKRRMLDDVVQTIHVQDRTISEHVQRMAAERKISNDQRVKTTELESCVADLKSNLHQSATDVAIWRTRYEDTISRIEKKRKLNDDSYTELITLTSEVNFLRNRHEEDAKRIQKYIHESLGWSQQVQTLQVKLALEIGK